jgi:anti-sigma B factor antagonist
MVEAISDQAAGGTEFRVTTESIGGTTVVAVEGEVDLASAPGLADALATACERPDLALLVVDLSQVTLLDSTGLSVLIERDATLSRAERATVLRLVVNTPLVLRVFSITGLDSVFEIFERREDALAPTA